jgi:predicted DNA binding CopG/RHH family protein
MKVILSKYEQRIEDALSKGEYANVSDLENTKRLFQEAAKNYRELQETKSITLRVNKEDLIKVKVKAKRNGLHYQTLVNLLIRQYVRGETEVVI